MSAMGGKQTSAHGDLVREENQRCSMVSGVSAEGFTTDRDLPPNSRIQDSEQGWNARTDMHAVEFCRTVYELSVIRAHGTGKFQD